MYGNAPHGEDCIHGRRDVAVDPGNWAPHNATPAQINALIAQAQRNLDVVMLPMMGQNPRPVPGAWPVQVIDGDDNSDDGDDDDDDVRFLGMNPRPIQRDA
jgi:hypothetical protein